MEDEPILADSPTIRGIRLAQRMRTKFPESFHSHIELALWQSIGDAYCLRGGFFVDDSELIPMAVQAPIIGITPLRQMGMLC